MHAQDVEKDASALAAVDLSPQLPLEGDEEARDSVELPPTLPSETPQHSSSSSSLDKKELDAEVTVSVEPVILPTKAGSRLSRYLLRASVRVRTKRVLTPLPR